MTIRMLIAMSAVGLLLRACIKTNSLIYMTMEPASSQLLAD